MTQTAVEWLIEQMLNQMELRIENTQTGIGLFEQAKEMEKEQIIIAYDKGEFNQGCNGNAEQYYNKMYGGNK
jgi:hypothetical protein